MMKVLFQWRSPEGFDESAAVDTEAVPRVGDSIRLSGRTNPVALKVTKVTWKFWDTTASNPPDGKLQHHVTCSWCDPDLA